LTTKGDDDDDDDDDDGGDDDDDDVVDYDDENSVVLIGMTCRRLRQTNSIVTTQNLTSLNGIVAYTALSLLSSCLHGRTTINRIYSARPAVTIATLLLSLNPGIWSDQ